MQLPPTPKAGMEGLVYWARVIGSARSADTYDARHNFEHLKAIRKSMFANKDSEADALTPFIHTAEPWVLHAEGNNEAALTMQRDMADREDKTGEQVDFPLREMSADLLMETGNPRQALVDYESDLRLNPNRFNGLYGAARAAELAGRPEKARSYYSQVMKMCAGGDSNRPELRRAISFVDTKYRQRFRVEPAQSSSIGVSVRRGQNLNNYRERFGAAA